MHESNIVLKMWGLLDCYEPDTSERKLDRERDEKIKYGTEMLKENKISVVQFLEALSIDKIIPNKGVLDCNFSNAKKVHGRVFFKE